MVIWSALQISRFLRATAALKYTDCPPLTVHFFPFDNSHSSLHSDGEPADASYLSSETHHAISSLPKPLNSKVPLWRITRPGESNPIRSTTGDLLHIWILSDAFPCAQNSSVTARASSVLGLLKCHSSPHQWPDGDVVMFAFVIAFFIFAEPFTLISRALLAGEEFATHSTL